MERSAIARAEPDEFEYRGHLVTTLPARESHDAEHPHHHHHPIDLVIDGRQIPVMAHHGRFMTHLFPWKFYDDLADLARDLIDIHERAINRPAAEDEAGDG